MGRSAGRVRDEPRVGIGEAAQRLGVATSTLRSWERRYGLTRPQRAAGAHRRYSAADLTRLAAMQELIRRGLPAARAAALLTPGAAASRPGELATRLREAAGAMDAALITAVLHAALLGLGTLRTWDEILAPLLIGLGDQWRDRHCCVDQEHLLSDTAQAVMRSHAYYCQGSPPAGRPVLLLAAPGERHTLPLAALAAALAEHATPAILLSDLPHADLIHALGALRPRAALAWARTPPAASIATLHALRHPGRAVYAAGPGWETAALPGAIPHLATLAAATRALASSFRPAPRPDQAAS